MVLVELVELVELEIVEYDEKFDEKFDEKLDLFVEVCSIGTVPETSMVICNRNSLEHSRGIFCRACLRIQHQF